MRIRRLTVQKGRFGLRELLDELSREGLERMLVEGGGRTVSAFLDAGLLDRLHLTVAPVVLGSGGVPGITVPAPSWRPTPHAPCWPRSRR